MIAIKTIDLEKRYGDRIAVNKLNLSIEQGELFSLLGTNGAGKTTTIKMLSCLSSPTSGEAILLGDSIVKNPFAVKEKISVSPQETAVASNLTVRENLQLIAKLYGSSKKDAIKRAEHYLSIFRYLAYSPIGGFRGKVSRWICSISRWGFVHGVVVGMGCLPNQVD